MKACFYFQVHQPLRLKRFSIFESHEQSVRERYFDNGLNRQILEKVAKKCYLPTNALMLELLEKHPGMRVSYSLTGVFMEQCKMFAPYLLDSFAALAKTGRVEFLSETYYHSLAALFPSKDEFVEQVKLHQREVEKLGGKTSVFRNTEAMFSNEIAYLAQRMGYEGILTEGIEHVLGWRSPNYLYSVKSCEGIKAMLRNYKLSDDIGYRFSAKWWSEYPLTADKYAKWLSSLEGDCVNVFMDYETFGEHHWEDTGIFEFLRALPGEMGKHPNLEFVTPSMLVKSAGAVGEIDVPHVISWADMERDTSAWLGNEMQRECFGILQELEAPIKELKDGELLSAWRMLQNSDHLYYLCTKSLSDQDVHNYFSPYDSPFDAYVNFRNILEDLRGEVKARQKA
ncbi:Alpha-amylase [Candidatus Anstonella stagnisolia]|nr:Alpha-amylase [Candidatus Anstonella stagnisolia]